jgi:DNA-binding response OmpR family regulator
MDAWRLTIKRVLVVDDEPMIRQLAAECLAEAGYHVDTAANGSDALRVMRRHAPDLIVLDLMMPQLDATGFVERMRRQKRFAQVAVVIMTAAYGALDVAKRLGAQACVSKPFELDHLVAEVERLIGRPGSVLSSSC